MVRVRTQGISRLRESFANDLVPATLTAVCDSGA